MKTTQSATLAAMLCCMTMVTLFCATSAAQQVSGVVPVIPAPPVVRFICRQARWVFHCVECFATLCSLSPPALTLHSRCMFGQKRMLVDELAALSWEVRAPLPPVLALCAMNSLCVPCLVLAAHADAEL